MVKIRQIDADNVLYMWPFVDHYIASALLQEPLLTSLDQSLSACVNGTNTLLTIEINGTIVGAATLGLEDAAEGTILAILTMAGDRFSEWEQAAFNYIDSMAYAQKCVGIIALGRKAWERIRPDYTPIRIVFFKKV